VALGLVKDGRALLAWGALPGAVAAYRAAIRLRPDLALTHNNLGNALRAAGDRPGANAEYREAIRLEPDRAETHNSLGLALRASGDLPGAIAALHEAIRRKPDYAPAHHNLGVVLRAAGDLPGAIAAYRAAIRLRPDLAEAHQSLGHALRDAGDLPGAIAAYRAAIRLRPDDAAAHGELAKALRSQGRLDEALAAAREGVRLAPAHGGVRQTLAWVLLGRGDWDGAITEYRAAIRLGQDRDLWAHRELATALQARGDFDAAVAELRAVRELAGPGTPLTAEIDRATRLAPRLPAVLRGDDRPADAVEALGFAELCTGRRLYAAAARLYTHAFAADPSLARDRPAANKIHAYNAACVAALAGCEAGKDDPKPDDAAQADLRRRALDWLKADLDAYAEQLSDAHDRKPVRDHFLWWKGDPDLAGVRDAKALQALPEAERAAWRALWAEVDRLLEKSAMTP
jgi:tetratricopeptide (TPR) repeat protein